MRLLTPPTEEPSRGDQLLPRVPRFADSPIVWGAIAACVFALICIFGYFVHHMAFDAGAAVAMSGSYILGWAIGGMRYYALFMRRRP